MNNRVFDVGFYLLLTILLVFFTTILFVDLETIAIMDVFALCFMIVLIMLVFFTNTLIGLLSTVVFIFIYASYLIYQNLIYGMAINPTSYIWFVVLPLSAYFSGRTGGYIRVYKEKFDKLEKDIHEMVMVDEVTGFDNIKKFYKDTYEEMSRAKRHKIDLTIMIIQINFFKELKSIYGEEKTATILREMSRMIDTSIRNEDGKYKIDDDKIIITMPHTNKEGAKVVSEKIKIQFAESRIIISETEKVKIEIKTGVVTYDELVENPFQFKELAEKELEYDV